MGRCALDKGYKGGQTLRVVWACYGVSAVFVGAAGSSAMAAETVQAETVQAGKTQVVTVHASLVHLPAGGG